MSRIPKHSTRQFTWHPCGRIFVAEASDLARPMSKLSKLSIDGAFEFNLESHVTGKVVTVRQVATQYDAEGEALCFIFRPDRRHELFGQFEVRVLND